MSDELTCRDTTILVSAARERALTAVELDELRGHLDWCERCQAAREQFEILFRSVERYLHGDTADAEIR
ncbi:MAG: zf-HC2 domain-containing protein [Chromatiales bacterium]